MNGHVNRINNLPQDIFGRVPRAISLEELLQGHRFTAINGIILVQGMEHVIYGVHQGLPDPSAVFVQLGEPDEVDNKHIAVTNRLRFFGRHGLRCVGRSA